MLAKSRDRSVDDARVALVDRVVVDAEALHDTRAERLDHHVGGFGERQQCLAPFGAS